MDDVVPAQEILNRIAGHYAIRQIDPNYSGEVAERWSYADGSGEIGVVASVTQAYCHQCTRARLSTDGKLYTCLFAQTGADLRALLRQGANDRLLSHQITSYWEQRNDRYSQLRHIATGNSKPKIEMSYIGG
jgi:cyclic pyranopterin phosphate synthase